ncbi:SDR family oxidoreductase [Nocardia sp. NPDC127579]|uniref:SDR family oxidoreductase n=1 Tax=Nocardia sp. NPDC127579 TaxID=3345402 RepID=UPI00363E4C34
MSLRETALVTGASGLVGAEVVARLAAAGRPITALLHKDSSITRNDGTVLEPGVAVSGDIRLPGFGLLERDATELAERVGIIVHSAATTSFNAAPADYEELNVRGTAHAIELARDWDVPLVYISTAYVCGTRGGVVGEDELDVGQSFANGYEESKFRAEQLVRASEVDWVVVRPGIVTGASGTGVIRDYKNLYSVVKHIVQGRLRTLPGRYDATLALAPIDHVADVIAAAALDFDSAAGRTLHALGRDALSLREISDVLAEYPSFAVATFVPDTAFDESALAETERTAYRRVGSRYTSYFQRKLTFDTTRADILLGRPSPPTGKEYLRVLLDYCLESGYLGALPGEVEGAAR